RGRSAPRRSIRSPICRRLSSTLTRRISPCSRTPDRTIGHPGIGSPSSSPLSQEGKSPTDQGSDSRKGDYCLSAPRSGAEFVGNIDVTEAHQSLKYGLVHLGSAGLPSGPDLPCLGRGCRSRKRRTTS